MILWIKMFEFANVRKPSLRRKRKAELNHNGSIGDRDMAKQALPSPKTLRQLLNYNPENGKFLWRHRDRTFFNSDRAQRSWNSRFAGAEAFTAKGRQGYFSMVCGKNILAHRAAFAMVHGFWPDSQIDHIDGNRFNNSAHNLRNATPSQNRANTKSLRTYGAGWKGVFKSRSKWRAKISHNGKSINLGTFRCETAAAISYYKEAIATHGEYAFTNLGSRIIYE